MIESEPYNINELIKSGDIAGREALEHLAETGEYVFHGSPETIEELQPHQAVNHGQLDGDPAVAATTNVDQAIFRALIHRRRDEQVGNSNHFSAWSTSGAHTTYLALKSSFEALKPEDIGFVYAMKSDQFSSYRGEMRSDVPIKPNFSVIVDSDDLPEIKIFDTVDELKVYQEHLRITPAGEEKD